jgi:curli biogenesis system outer membrane secretion channel CsgG
MTRIFLVLTALLMAACTPVQMGSSGSKTVVTGSAGGSTATNANTSLERCSEPFGTVALLEDRQEDWYHIVTVEYHLPPTTRLLRLMAQQSNCFVVVERDRSGVNAMMRERELQQSGEMRKGSHFGKGQMVAADYTLTPTVLFSSNDSGGIGAAVSSLMSNFGGSAGQVLSATGGVKKREASTMLTLVENRSGVQIAAAEGSASKFDFGLLGSIFGGHGGVGLGGYENTPEGKIIAAAFADSFNQTVRALKNYRAQEVKGGLGKGGRLKIGK